MRPSVTGLACLLVLAAAVPLAAKNPPVESAVVKLEILHASGKMDSTAILVAREPRADKSVMYFLTGARAFRRPHGELVAVVPHARLVFADGRVIEVAPEAISLPPADTLDVAVIRAVADPVNLTPARMVFDTPAPGGVFVVASFDKKGRRAIVTEHVTTMSNGSITGDRSTAHLTAGYGAPALVENGVFALLGACSEEGMPIVTPLAAVRSFVTRHLPTLSVAPTAARQYTLSERVVNGPLLLAPCDTVNSGEVEVLLTLGPQEVPVDAAARLVHTQSLGQGEVSVISLSSRSVRLRYVLAGTSIPSYLGSEGCLDSTAVVVVDVRLVTSPHVGGSFAR